MQPASPILGFLCRFVIVFGLLVAPWPGWQDLYARFLRSGAGVVFGAPGSKAIHSTIHVDLTNAVPVDFGTFGSHAVVAFTRNPKADRELDTVIYIANREQADANASWSVTSCALSSRYLAYLPAALLVALILATDIAWRRRLWALAWGLVWIHLFILLQLVLMIAMKLYDNPDIGQVVISPFSLKIVSMLYECFVEHISTNLALAVPVWILVTFRRDDWPGLLVRVTGAGTQVR